MGLYYLEAYFNSSYTILLSPWAEAMVLVEVIVHSARLALSRKFPYSNQHIYYIEALEEKT